MLGTVLAGLACFVARYSRLNDLFIKLYSELCTVPLFTFNFDIAVLAGDNAMSHSQSNANAIVTSISAFIKALKNIGQIFLRDSWAIIST